MDHIPPSGHTCHYVTALMPIVVSTIINSIKIVIFFSLKSKLSTPEKFILNVRLPLRSNSNDSLEIGSF